MVVDDQAIVREGLATLLDLLPDVEVVGEAANGADAIDLAGRTLPDVVLMDLRMPVLGGAEATARLRSEMPGTAVIVLTTYADDTSIAAALAAGARGYLTKDAGRDELAAAVRAAASGQVTFARDVGERIASQFAAPRSSRERFPQLRPREAEVLDHIIAGENNRQIAAELYLSVGTVKSYVNDIFAKLGARDRAHAIALSTGRAK
ncbi:response regulator transcription factor [Arthrobacter sp. B2a2-09]|uniref:response regulator transcription factor n=1 Tax=Arthrobacter sp. B2a2-09 TaxID=2952822 RepID=UPI0022CD8CCD|nr:response regulator transcription factor [Arthrobacter sp. B2a2-09]MCZ9883132.1 response regulator transcription factor [Arthrobacter sp. B2a2-09]